LDYDYVLHIINFAILYSIYFSLWKGGPKALLVNSYISSFLYPTNPRASRVASRSFVLTLLCSFFVFHKHQGPIPRPLQPFFARRFGDCFCTDSVRQFKVCVSFSSKMNHHIPILSVFNILTTTNVFPSVAHLVQWLEQRCRDMITISLRFKSHCGRWVPVLWMRLEKPRFRFVARIARQRSHTAKSNKY
jgi:hypothetical protein